MAKKKFKQCKKIGLENHLVAKLILKLRKQKIEFVKCFTTRPDTLFGFSFLALSIDHPLSKFYKTDKEFIKFKEKCSKTGTTEGSIASAEKLGSKTDLLALNPLNEKH